jgi:hypothetical protein
MPVNSAQTPQRIFKTVGLKDCGQRKRFVISLSFA